MNLCLADSPSIVKDPPTVKRSGGPRTAEGKEQSRRNALKRGLRSKIVFPEDMAELVEKRTRDLIAEFSPKTPYEEMLVRDMAVSSVRFERCASLSVADLIRVVDRAAYCWEQDRRMSVEEYAARLSKSPEQIAWGLHRTRQGTSWLIERWEALGEIAREVGRWDDDQRRLAFDMLGVPRELRTKSRRVPDNDDAPELIALAEAQIDSLREEHEAVLDDLDDAERGMAMAGMPFHEDATTARLRKDEARARNDFAKARNELLRLRAKRTEEAVAPTAESKPENPQKTPEPASQRLEPSIRQMLTKDADSLEPPKVGSPTPTEKPLTRRARKERARREREAAGRR